MSNTGGTEETVEVLEGRLSPWRMIRLNSMLERFSKDVGEFVAIANQVYLDIEGYTVVEAHNRLVEFTLIMDDLNSDLEVARSTILAPLLDE